MKEITVDSYSIPAKSRSKNYYGSSTVVKSTGSGSSGTSGTNVAKEAAHAAKADLAGYADKAGYADNSGTADEATHAAKAYDLDDDSPVRDEFLSKVADRSEEHTSELQSPDH